MIVIFLHQKDVRCTFPVRIVDGHLATKCVDLLPGFSVHFSGYYKQEINNNKRKWVSS